ncbi:hypothetical protein, partial [Schaalia turicensis]|uniref:hypothetical protein n=1 Tax=Schaalia turicensis TaxID=131111 RepID=UPI001E401696
SKHINLKPDFSAPQQRKTTLNATHFIQPPSCPTPTSTQTFPHQNNEKPPKMPHIMSYNPEPPAPRTVTGVSSSLLALFGQASSSLGMKNSYQYGCSSRMI